MAIKVEILETSKFDNLEIHYPWPDHFWIRANFVQSLNGKVTDKTGELFLPSENDKLVFRFLRSTADCIVIGRKTLLEQPYRNIAISPAFKEFRHTDKPLQLIVISNTLEFPEGFFDNFGQSPLIVTSQLAEKNSVGLNNVAIKPLGVEKVDLSQLPNLLLELGHKRILCEGGPGLLTNLVNHDLVDEIDLTIANQFKVSSEINLFTGALKIDKENVFNFKKVFFDHENVFLQLLKI